MKTIRLDLDELNCPDCIPRIERLLSKQKGVAQANVIFFANEVKITFKDWMISVDELVSLIENIGYPVRSSKVSC